VNLAKAHCSALQSLTEQNSICIPWFCHLSAGWPGFRFHNHKPEILKNEKIHVAVPIGVSLAAVVALNEERFILRGNSIFACSRNGGTFDYLLPAEFRGRKMEDFALSDRLI
jgi:hypothetical protein